MTRTVFLLPLLGLVQIAAATESADEIIAACRQADDANARIACLEAALRGEAPANPAAVAEEIAASSTHDPAPDPDPSPAGIADDNAEAAAGIEPEPPGPAATATTSTTAVAAAEAAPPEPVAGNATDIGREQVEARTMTREQQLASLESASGLEVAAYTEVPYKRIVVHLKNGQVWRQITGDDQYFRVDLKRNQTVDINETSIGGYKLRLNEMRRTIRVERIQ